MARLAEATGPAPSRWRAIDAAPLHGLMVHGGLLAALGVALLYGVRAMGPALGPSGMIEEEGRQHIFWMARFRDPRLFPNDLIADYFQTLSPPGYAALYWALSPLADPFDVARVLPLALGLATALATYALTRRLYPSATAAFLATVLHVWYVWQEDLPSGSPRAFTPPLLTALAWALVSRRPWLAVGLVGLSALLYPAAGVLGVALMGIWAVWSLIPGAWGQGPGVGDESGRAGERESG